VKERPPIVAFRARESAGGSLRAYARDSRPWPFHSARMHGHRFYDLNYFHRGEGEVRLPDRSVRIGPGHVFLAPPGELHDTSGIAHMGGWIVEFTAEMIPAGAPLAVPGQRLPTVVFAVVPQAERASWEERLTRLVAEAGGAKLGSMEATRALLQLLLIDLARLLSPEKLKPTAAPLLREVLAIIDRRFAEPRLSLAEVARAAGRSTSHVSALVRGQTGLTVVEWITERRMEEARRRLRETDEDVGIVAERVGYLDPAYFARVFRRVHGLSARDFRNAR
jgi:AraC-like DNA-binding protein